MKRTWAGEVRNVSLLVASAVNSEGFREILGIYEGAKEDKSRWSAFLRHLVDRGLNGVRLIISDACRWPYGECGGVSTPGTLATLHGAACGGARGAGCRDRGARPCAVAV